MTEEKKPSEGSGDETYDKLSTVDDNNPDEGGDDASEVEHKTATEAIEGTGNLTDTQSIIKTMYPDLGYPHLNYLMIARIWPESYNPMLSIQVKHLLKAKPELSMAEAIAICTTAQSIGIDGEGRIELEVLGGATHEENLEKAKNTIPGL